MKRANLQWKLIIKKDKIMKIKEQHNLIKSEVHQRFQRNKKEIKVFMMLTIKIKQDLFFPQLNHSYKTLMIESLKSVIANKKWCKSNENPKHWWRMKETWFFLYYIFDKIET